MSPLACPAMDPDVLAQLRAVEPDAWAIDYDEEQAKRAAALLALCSGGACELPAVEKPSDKPETPHWRDHDH